MREKLIVLLEHDDCPLFMVFGDNVGLLADHLIAHGVTIQTEAENPKTNGDRIRAMTDEELMMFIEDTGIAGCPNPSMSCRSSCHDCILNWLKQPAED